MKKIRLTESELIKLIQKVIKEDEMTSSTAPAAKGCRTSLGTAKGIDKTYSLANFKPLVVIEVTGDVSMVTAKMGTNTMKEKVKIGSVVPVKREIIMSEGSEITFKDVQDFGQPILSCKNGVASVSAITE